MSPRPTKAVRRHALDATPSAIGTPAGTTDQGEAIKETYREPSASAGVPSQISVRPYLIDAQTLDMLRRSVAAGGPIPTYHRLELALRDAMKSGALPPGSKLPAHYQLANLLGVGRNTLRGALRRLDQDNLIESNNGGTYVKRALD